VTRISLLYAQVYNIAATLTCSASFLIRNQLVMYCGMRWKDDNRW